MPQAVKSRLLLGKIALLHVAAEPSAGNVAHGYLGVLPVCVEERGVRMGCFFLLLADEV